MGMVVPKRSEMVKCVLVDFFDLKKGYVQISGKYQAMTVRLFEDQNLKCRKWMVFMAKGHPALSFGDVIYVNTGNGKAYVEKGITLYNLHATSGMCPDIIARLLKEVFDI
jgi:hypothetical protein